MFIGDAVNLIEREHVRACALFPRFNNHHEGYAVILEELDEAWSVIKQKDYPGKSEQLQKELVQVAAMALRFLTDLL